MNRTLTLSNVPLGAVCLYVESVIEALEKDPSVAVTDLTEGVNLAEVIILLLSCKGSPDVKKCFDALERHWNNDPRLSIHLSEAFKVKQDLVLQKISLVFPGKPPKDVNAFLEQKRNSIMLNKQKILEAKRANDAILQETADIFKSCIEELQHLAYRINLNSAEFSVSEKLINEMITLLSGQMKLWKLKLQENYYTPAKIDELRSARLNGETNKDELRKKIDEATKKKQLYDSLGIEFKHHAQIYKGYIRQAKIHENIENLTTTP